MKELTPEKEAEEWLVKVRGFTVCNAFDEPGTLFYPNSNAVIWANIVIKDHPTFVREVVEVMEGLGYNYVIILNEFDWCKSGALSDSTSVKIVDHNWPLAAIKAAKQTPEIRKIMEAYDAES